MTTTNPSPTLPLRDLSTLEVRPIHAVEKARWDQLMREHHYLSFGWMVGESLRHVALLEGEWVALLGWGAAALSGPLRNRFIGWPDDLAYRRLHYLANNIRYLILPSGRIRNLASKVLALSVKRLSSDWQRIHGHPLHAVETFVDPARFSGTCYKAAGWTCLGMTRGFGYRSGRYIPHHHPKTVWIRPLSRDAFALLCGPDDNPRLTGEPRMTVALDSLPLEGIGGLWDRLASLPDPRKKRGVRHPLLVVLKIIIAGIFCGNTNVRALGEWSQSLHRNQDLLARLGCFRSPSRQCFVPPSWTTIHRTLRDLDIVAFERILGEWFLSWTPPSEPVSVDGKVLKGSATPLAKAMTLLSAFLGLSGVVIAQTPIPDKTNEIPEFSKILAPLPLEGRTVTADALHTQREHARFLAEDKKADFVLIVKGNQDSLHDALASPHHHALLAPPPPRGTVSPSVPPAGTFSPSGASGPHGR